ncbi:hypothetical protein OROMI_006519 [Orobanche minor]
MPSNVVQKKRVARILFFKIKPSQEILKIRDGTPLEAEEILTYIKGPRNGSVCYFSSKLDVPSNVVQKKRVARILFFKIKPSQEILKIRDGTPLEAEEILTYIKGPRNGSVCYFSSKLDVPKILKIRDGTPLEAEEILTFIKGPRNGSVCYFSSKMPSNVVQKKRVARILFFKIKPSQEILKIRDGTPLEAEEILTYIKGPRNGSVCYFSSKLDVPSNVVQKKRVAQILFFKIRPSQEILKVRDGTPLEAEEILTYIKRPSKRIDVPSNVVQKKRVARILFFKIKPSQEIFKIRDGTPLEAEEILTFIKGPRNGSVCYFSSKMPKILKIRDGTPLEPSQEILKIRDGTPLEAEEILTFIKGPRNGSVCYFSSKLDVPSNVVQKKRVARILFFKIKPSQEIFKIRDGTPLEAEEILTFIKGPRNGSVCYFSSKMPKILKIRDGTPLEPSQEILKIRDGTPLEAEEILTFIKGPRNGSVCYFSSKMPSNVVQKKRVARILFFKIKPSQEILKIRDGTPLEAEEILTYIKGPRNGSVCYFSSKLDVPSNVVQKKRVARILFFKIRPSQEILKVRDGTPLEAEEILTYIKRPSKRKKRVARILFFKIRPSQEILKIRDGTPLEAEEILTFIKGPRNGSVCYFSSKLDVPSNVVQKKRVARILFFKIKPSQEIFKIRDGTPLEAEEILTFIKGPRNGSVCYFSSKPSQEILKIRDGTPLEAEEILTFIKGPRNGSMPSNVVQKKRVARILFFKIKPSQEILKIRDGTPLEAEEILTYIKGPRNGSVCYFSSKLDVPSNVVQKKRVARILFFKIRPSQEILKVRDGTPLEAEEILTYIKRPSKRKILKIRDGTPLEAEEILTFIKGPRNGSMPSNVVQKKRVARILFFKIKPSQEILKIRDGTPLEAEEILTYIKGPRNGSVCYFSSKLDVPSNVVQKKRVARILFFKIRPSQEILKVRDGTPLEAEEILTYIKRPSKRIDVPSNVVQKKRVARILFFKIKPSQEILKIRDGTHLEAEEILTYIKGPRNGSVCYFSSKLDVPSNVVQKKRVARILFFKIKPSQEILKIRDGTPLEAKEILTYIKRPSKRIGLLLF